MTNTQMNEGFRYNFKTLGERNFENVAVVQYASNHEGLFFNGTVYHAGVSLPFDVGGVSYSVAAKSLLRLYWDQGWLVPLS